MRSGSGRRGGSSGVAGRVAVRVIAANQAPDHTTIARLRQRHEKPLGELFGEVLGLCGEAGLVHVDVVAVDGTKVHANASQHANRDYERIAREILEEAQRVDAEEDEQFGDRRGDELVSGRRGWLRDAKRRLDDRRAEEAGRSRPRGRSGSRKPSGAWTRSCGRSARRTLLMRPTGPWADERRPPLRQAAGSLPAAGDADWSD